MRKVCIARRWKQRECLDSFHCVYIQNVIRLFIIITFSSSSGNICQNSSGCCCPWSDKAWVNEWNMLRDIATSVRLNTGPLEQHHSRIEITTKSMIDHMLSEKVWFVKAFIHVIPGARSISKCCSNSIRIPSLLRNSHCEERRSHLRLNPHISRHMTAFLYWISPRLHLFNKNTSGEISSKINCCEVTCWKQNQNVSRHSISEDQS